jgi:hypothetical protein
MLALRRFRGALALAFVLTTSFSAHASANDEKKSATANEKKSAATAAAPATPAGRPVAWRDPGDISALDLASGPGAAESAPAPPFTFVEEVTLGTSPKFKVRDARGHTWSVKLGEEAQAETVATRLVWAMGYHAEETYYFDRVEVRNLPKLARGQQFVEGRSTVRGVRFEARRGLGPRAATRDWEQNPFTGTREFNGLKVLMALLGNYDIREENNLIVAGRDEEGEPVARYLVSDIGATLGKVGGLGGKRSKNNLADYSASKFVTGVENGFVKFDFNTKPKGLGFFASVFKPGYGKSQAKKEKVMSNIPVEDARWMGTRLARLSDAQLRDAFRAAGYAPATADGFVAAIRGRINQLTQLPAAASVAAGLNQRR